MYLSYIDDSCRTDRKKQTFLAAAAVLIHDKIWEAIEPSFGRCIKELLPEELLENFQEFKACDLYNGKGVFEAIDQSKRFQAIETLLSIIRDQRLIIAYGGVDIKLLERLPTGSANPIDVAFRLVLDGIDGIVAAQQDECDRQELALVITDDRETEKATKAQLRKSYRQYRSISRPPEWKSGSCPHLLDDLFFGDSKESLGLQLADLSAYFIGKHLEGDKQSLGFYMMLHERILYSKLEPQGAQPITVIT